MKNKPTLTMGIPAYNEEKNIVNMIQSVIKQKQENFILEKILIISDGSGDNTEKYVKRLTKKYQIIQLVADKKRLGKASRLNQLYKLNRSDFLGTFDGDILLERDNELQLMIKTISENQKINVVAASQVPAKTKTWMGRFSVVSFSMFYEAAKNYRDGNNIHCLQGSASIIRKSFAKTLKMPKNTTSDQGFLYVSSIKKSRSGFKFVKSTRIIFNAVSTFKDWQVLGHRTIVTDKQNMAEIFGRKILEEYQLPKRLVYVSIIKSFLKNPVSTIGSIIMNIYIRKYISSQAMNMHALGIWEIVSSSKEAIGL